MKDTIITARRKKIELLTLLVCFIIANLANLYAIIVYRTSFMEVFTSIFYIIIASLALYAGWSILRLLFYSLTRLFTRRRKR